MLIQGPALTRAGEVDVLHRQEPGAWWVSG